MTHITNINYQNIQMQFMQPALQIPQVKILVLGTGQLPCQSIMCRSEVYHFNQRLFQFSFANKNRESLQNEAYIVAKML